MERFHGHGSAAVGTAKGILNLFRSAATPTSRAKIYDVNVGCTAAPADAATQFGVIRTTAVGTENDGFTPVNLDPDGPASASDFSRGAFSVEPTRRAFSSRSRSVEESGRIIVVDPGGDKPILEAATLQCVHCGKHWIVVPGSGKVRRGAVVVVPCNCVIGLAAFLSPIWPWGSLFFGASTQETGQPGIALPTDPTHHNPGELQHVVTPNY